MAVKEIIISERIDRNKTKHQEVETACDRCGGAGQSDRWAFTGRQCYKCGGSGRQRVNRKIYTEEHAAKLEANRIKREEKKKAERIAEAPEKNKVALEKSGYNQEKIYVVKGDTYSIKDELKEKGARFSSRFSSWFFTENKPEYDTYELETAKLYKLDTFGEVVEDYSDESHAYISAQKKIGEPEELVSEHFGTIGEKIEMELTVTDAFWIDTAYGSSCINKLVDEQGNIFVWMTSARDLSDDADEETGMVRIKGTIKEHDKYDGKKQTILTRCKVIEK